jgi:hypothetical protein
MNRRKLSTSPTVWLIFVGFVALLTRLMTIVLYQPVAYSDTPSYRRLAQRVLRGFSGYDGTRTPGYPVFIALVGNDRNVWLAQLTLGFITTLLIFFIGWKLTNKPWFGGLLALLHTLNLGQLFFESNLLTESLTTFLVLLTTAGVVVWLVYPKYRRPWLAFLLGVFSSTTFLVRPLFIYLPFYLLIFLWILPRLIPLPVSQTADGDPIVEHQPLPRSMSVVAGIAFIVPVVLLMGGWVSFIHEHFGEWSFSTMTGYNLIQHTGSYFEYVPDEYAALRDTYIKYRDEHIAEFGTQTNAIWDAIPEMSKVSGYSFYALSRVLARISIDLILRHPDLYLKNAISGWWLFWRVPIYWSADALRYPWLTGGVTTFIIVERAVIFLFNLVFIVASILFAVIECISAIRRKPSPLSIARSNPATYAFLWMLLGNVWIASILQTLLDHGDNPRFLVPLQSMVVVWVALFIQQITAGKPISSPAITQS